MRFPLSQKSFCCLKSKLLCSQSLILCINVHSNLVLWVFLFSINLLTPGHLKAFSIPVPVPAITEHSCTDLSSISSCSYFLCPSVLEMGVNTVAQLFKDRDLWFLPEPLFPLSLGTLLMGTQGDDHLLKVKYMRTAPYSLLHNLFLLYLASLVFQKSPININEPTYKSLMLTPCPSPKKNEIDLCFSSPVRFPLLSVDFCYRVSLIGLCSKAWQVGIL